MSNYDKTLILESCAICAVLTRTVRAECLVHLLLYFPQVAKIGFDAARIFSLLHGISLTSSFTIFLPFPSHRDRRRNLRYLQALRTMRSSMFSDVDTVFYLSIYVRIFNVRPD